MNSIKSFFQEHHNLRRYPFHPPGTTGEPRQATTNKSFWSDFKGFFTKQHNFGRSPFAGMPTSWM
jgi:hypothetical protein